ncbi:hypothetical protein VPH35_089384 [Triticum aestivum]
MFACTGLLHQNLPRIIFPHGPDTENTHTWGPLCFGGPGRPPPCPPIRAGPVCKCSLKCIICMLFGCLHALLPTWTEPHCLVFGCLHVSGQTQGMMFGCMQRLVCGNLFC